MNINDYLSKEQFELVDRWCGKPVSKVRYVVNMPSELFNEHRHKMVCVTVGVWAYVDSIVTREDYQKLNDLKNPTPRIHL